LTANETGRTVHVCADRISAIVPYVNDDEGVQCTKVWVLGYYDTNNDSLQVNESPEEILRRIKEGDNAILRAFCDRYGVEEGVQRYQTGEPPPPPSAHNKYEMTESKMEHLRTVIDSANVSEAAKEFYRGHLTMYRTSGGWTDEQHKLIRELDMAGLLIAM
jgi:hypothetical protein